MLNLQIGHVEPLSSNHLSIHSLWKKCRQGMVLSSSPSSYSTKHTMHLRKPSSSLSWFCLICSAVTVREGKLSTIAFGVVLLSALKSRIYIPLKSLPPPFWACCYVIWWMISKKLTWLEVRRPPERAPSSSANLWISSLSRACDLRFRLPEDFLSSLPYRDWLRSLRNLIRSKLWPSPLASDD